MRAGLASWGQRETPFWPVLLEAPHSRAVALPSPTKPTCRRASLRWRLSRTLARLPVPTCRPWWPRTQGLGKTVLLSGQRLIPSATLTACRVRALGRGHLWGLLTPSALRTTFNFSRPLFAAHHPPPPTRLWAPQGRRRHSQLREDQLRGARAPWTRRLLRELSRRRRRAADLSATLLDTLSLFLLGGGASGPPLPHQAGQAVVRQAGV